MTGRAYQADQGGGGAALTGWETDEDGNLVSDGSGDLITGVGSKVVQFVDGASAEEDDRSSNIEVRDADPLILIPYAQMIMGYGQADQYDGYIEMKIANDVGGTRLTVFRADIEGTEINASGTDNTTLLMKAQASILLHSGNSVDPTWVVDTNLVLHPGGGGGGLALPVKAGAQAEEDFEWWTNGQVVVNSAVPRLEVYVGGVNHSVLLTPIV